MFTPVTHKARYSVERPTFSRSATYWRATPLLINFRVLDLFACELHFPAKLYAAAMHGLHSDACAF